jgi:hypothetical protein
MTTHPPTRLLLQLTNFFISNPIFRFLCNNPKQRRKCINSNKHDKSNAQIKICQPFIFSFVWLCFHGSTSKKTKKFDKFSFSTNLAPLSMKMGFQHQRWPQKQLWISPFKVYNKWDLYRWAPSLHLSLSLLSLKSQHHHRPEDMVNLTYLMVALVRLLWFHSFLSSLLHKHSKPQNECWSCHLCGTRILHVALK